MGREVRTKAQAVEITRLRAEAEIKSDAIQRLRKQRDELLGERDSLTALIPGSYYMDPPDGGDVPVVEQFRRMAKDAERWRCLIRHASPHPRAVPVEMALCPLTVQFWAADLIAEFSAALARAEKAELALVTLMGTWSTQCDTLQCVEKERDAALAAFERCKTVHAATAEGWRETQAELDRLTTLRPASEHDGETRVYWHMRNGRGEWSAVGPYVSATGTHFTPLPDVKEADK